MGYELKIMVGRKSKDIPNLPPQNRFDVLATVDLCQSDSKAEIRMLSRSYQLSDNWVWVPDDNCNMILHDDWGNGFAPVSVEAVLEALIADFSKYGYKRFEWAIGLLSKMENDNLSVIFYGH